MIWLPIVINGLILIGMAIVLWRVNRVKNVFDQLLIDFVMSNQENYNAHKSIVKKTTSNTEALFKQVKELNRVESIINNLGDISTSLMDTSRSFKNSNMSNELKSNIKELKDISKNIIAISKENIRRNSNG